MHKLTFIFMCFICSFSDSLAAVHTIAQFVVHHLKLDSVPSRVVYSWLFVCRQSYNTAEGLLVLMSYSLHQHIARALLRCGQKNKPQSQVGGEKVRRQKHHESSTLHVPCVSGAGCLLGVGFKS